MTAKKWLITGIVAVVLVIGVVAAVALTGGDDEKKVAASTTTTTSSTTTTTAPPVAPLTGLPDPSGASLTRPSLAIKVENTPDARPQGGVDQADVVYEEVVEGGITRWIAVFNSQVPETVGPVRSVRAVDPQIVWPLGGIFAYSGGAQGNVDLINDAPVHAIDESAATGNGGMERNAPGQPPRGAPHNLYAHGPQLLELGGDPKPPRALFAYLPPTTPATGQALLSFRVGFEAGYDPTWVWDVNAKGWGRNMDGRPHLAVGDRQIMATNVVVQFTGLDGEGDWTVVGEGDAWIFSDGTVRMGRWSRPDINQPATYTDPATGQPILLRPGNTWVELAPNGSPVDLEAAPVPPPTTAPPATVPTTTTKPKKK